VRHLRTRYNRAVGSATPTVGKPTAARAGVEAVNALTFHPDHSVGADHHRHQFYQSGDLGALWN
jgi:hypothetical protein